MNSIEIKNLTMDFRRDRVLHGITHSFEKGKIHGVVGNNGSGKTVMFKCICGFLNPTGGKVTVEGKRIGRDRDFPDPSRQGHALLDPGPGPRADL